MIEQESERQRAEERHAQAIEKRLDDLAQRRYLAKATGESCRTLLCIALPHSDLSYPTPEI